MDSGVSSIRHAYRFATLFELIFSLGSVACHRKPLGSTRSFALCLVWLELGIRFAMRVFFFFWGGRVLLSRYGTLALTCVSGLDFPFAGDEMTRVFWKSIKDKVMDRLADWFFLDVLSTFTAGDWCSYKKGHSFNTKYAAYLPVLGVGH